MTYAAASPTGNLEMKQWLEIRADRDRRERLADLASHKHARHTRRAHPYSGGRYNVPLRESQSRTQPSMPSCPGNDQKHCFATAAKLTTERRLFRIALKCARPATPATVEAEKASTVKIARGIWRNCGMRVCIDRPAESADISQEREINVKGRDMSTCTGDWAPVNISALKQSNESHTPLVVITESARRTRIKSPPCPHGSNTCETRINTLFRL